VEGPRKILIIEDSPTVCHMVEEVIVKKGYKIMLAVNGEEGLEMAKEGRPDLILLDITLPGIDGFEVLHRLRRDPETGSILTVMLTSKGDTGHIRRAIELKADDYLIKPFEAEELLTLVKRYI